MGTVALSFCTEVNVLANVGIYHFSDEATHFLSPAEPLVSRAPVAPSAFGEEVPPVVLSKERAKAQ